PGVQDVCSSDLLVVCFEVLGYLLRVFAMLIDAQLQRFQTRQRYPGVEWGQSSAGIAQDARACLERECWCAQIGVLETVVCGIWGDKVGKHWLAVAFDGPVELAAVDDDTTHGRAIA